MAALSGSFCVLIFLLIVADLHSDTFVNLKLSRRRRRRGRGRAQKGCLLLRERPQGLPACLTACLLETSYKPRLRSLCEKRLLFIS